MGEGATFFGEKRELSLSHHSELYKTLSSAEAPI